MVSKEVVLETIKKMYASGIDDSVVKSTLKDVGLSETEMEQIMAEAKGIQPPQPAAEAAEKEKIVAAEEKALEEPTEQIIEPVVKPEHEMVAEATAEKVKAHLDEARSEQDMRQTAAHAVIEEHREKLEEVHKKVGEIGARIGTSPLIGSEAAEKINSIDKKINVLEKEIGEVKANTIALQSLLKKILEANRKIIGSSGRKK